MDADILINDQHRIPLEELEITAIRAQGPGGQNVNKVASAISLRYDLNASSLPPAWKARLLAARDRRITRDGFIVIKAQRYRTQERNRADAIERLAALIGEYASEPKPRRPTRPTRASKERRLETKERRGRLKSLRSGIRDRGE